MNELQKTVMEYVIGYIKVEHMPVPRQKILEQVAIGEIKEFTVANALDSLIKKGYIRRSSVVSRTTSYVQLRGI